MNKVTKIHLGRQAFTISVDAYGELRSYLDAITRQVEDSEVLNEIELRMAELLAEHGLAVNDVILSTDVNFLKEQLGKPTDFKGDDEQPHNAARHPAETKRLFRDTDNAMVAGVAAGLAKYFEIDVLLVRLLFVLTIFLTAGWGILIYIVMWLLIPEAKSPSDRLLMAGRPVTVNSLKEIVKGADVKGAVHKAHAALAGPINTLFGLLLRLIGLVIILFGLSVLFTLVAIGTYYIARSGTWLQDNIFPIGIREHLLLYTAGGVVAFIALFVILIGITFFRRRWPLQAWTTGSLVGLLFVGIAVGGALAADVYPNVRAAYSANLHSTTRLLKPFSAVSISGANISEVSYLVADKYAVVLSYYGRPDLGSIKTSVSNGKLTVDSSQFKWRRNCSTICFPASYHLTVAVYAPTALQVEDQFDTIPIVPSAPGPIQTPRALRMYEPI